MPSPRYARPRRRALSGTAKALIAVGVILAVIAGAGFAGAVWFQNRLDANIERLGDPFAELPARPSPAPSNPETRHEAVNLLVLGSDSRISAGDPSHWQAGAQRTDTIMLVHLPADRAAAQVVSFPRDALVDIPGHGQNRINAAFSFGGPSLLIQTMEQLTGVHIDHFVVTDFTSFTRMTDALGGVQIRIPHDIGDGNRVFFEAGVHQMTGEQALSYVRQRHGLVDGDFGRVQRQQNWMRAIMREVFEQEILKDIPKLTDFSSTVLQSVAVDEGMTLPRMVTLGYEMKDLRGDNVTFMTAPYAGTGWSPDGRQSIVLLDEAKSAALFNAFATDTVREFLAANPEGAVILPANPE